VGAGAAAFACPTPTDLVANRWWVWHRRQCEMAAAARLPGAAQGLLRETGRRTCPARHELGRDAPRRYLDGLAAQTVDLRAAHPHRGGALAHTQTGATRTLHYDADRPDAARTGQSVRRPWTDRGRYSDRQNGPADRPPTQRAFCRAGDADLDQ